MHMAGRVLLQVLVRKLDQIQEIQLDELINAFKDVSDDKRLHSGL